MEQTVRIHTNTSIHIQTISGMHTTSKNSIIAKFRLRDLKPTLVEGPLTFFKRLNLSGRKGDPDTRDLLAGLDAFLGLGCEGGHSYVLILRKSAKIIILKNRHLLSSPPPLLTQRLKSESFPFSSEAKLQRMFGGKGSNGRRLVRRSFERLVLGVFT